MIARAASIMPSGLASATSLSRAAVMREASSGSPITPVEAMNTSSAESPVALATPSPTSSTAANPRRPVNALALPELTTSALARPPFSLSRHQSTGAEGHLERVNTPATAAGASNIAIVTSVRPA